jgi:hypothetical protein
MKNTNKTTLALKHEKPLRQMDLAGYNDRGGGGLPWEIVHNINTSSLKMGFWVYDSWVQRVREDVLVGMEDLRRKEAAARAKCPDLSVESYHAEICGSALTETTPRPYRH